MNRVLRRELYFDMLVDCPDGNLFNVPSDFTLHCLSVYAKIKYRRYLLPRVHRKRDRRKCIQKSTTKNRLPTRSFSFTTEYRVTRLSFHDLVSHIENHPEFQSPPNSTKTQAKPEYQLLVLLKYLGTQGNAATNTSLGTHFGAAILDSSSLSMSYLLI
jgi:hypothetical protein